MWLYLQKTKSHYLLFTNNLNSYIIHTMEPKRYVKKCHFNGFDFEKELYKLLNEQFQGLVIGNNRMGVGNYIVTSPSVAELINSMYKPSEIEIGEPRLEDNTLIQDIQLRPRRGMEYFNLDFNITNKDNNYFL